MKHAVTKSEALAFIHVLTSGKPAVHLAACLGHENVPAVKDFEKLDLDGQERADKFLKLIKGYVEVLWEELGRLEQEDSLNSIPGTRPADLEPVAAADDFDPDEAKA